MGYDSYLVPDACATSNRIGFDGVDYDPDVVHNVAVASLNGEFAAALSVDDTLALLHRDSQELSRRQANE